MMINTRILLTLALVLLYAFSFAQDIKKRDLANPEIEITEFANCSTIRDLSLPDLIYNGDETFILYNSRNEVVATLLRESKTEETDGISLNNNLSGASLSHDYRDPIHIKIDCEKVELGEYQISVISKDNKILHLRTFRIVTPKPIVDTILTENRINDRIFNTTDTLWVNWDKTFTNGSVTFGGTYLNQKFQSVFIGHREYEMIQDTNNLYQYTFGKQWASDKIFSLELGFSDVIFERQHSSKLASKKVFITAPQPKISGETLEFYVEEGESKTLINLDVENVFSGAKVLIKPLKQSPDFPNSIGERPIEFGKSTGSISFPIYFESIKGNEQKSFKVQIINSDQKRSEFKLINIIKKQTTVKMMPLESRKPLLSDFENSVKFEWLGGDYFSSVDTNLFVLQFENLEPIRFEGTITDHKTLTANIKFPKKLITDKVKFKITNGTKQSWNGEIAEIQKRPIIENTDLIYRGGETHIKIENAANVELMPAKHYDFLAISKVENENSKDYTIQSNQNAEDFAIEVKLLDHVIKTIAYQVLDYPTLDSIDLEQIVDKQWIKKDDIIIIDSDNNDKLTLSIPIDSLTITKEAKFYAQIYKKDGTPIGEKKTFIKNNKGNQFMTSLNTQRGLKSGEQFNIEISNPNDVITSYKSYVKKKPADKLIITAGLSLVDIKLTKNNEDSPKKSNVLDGVNLGFYYMFENYKNPSLSLIGMGPNISLIGDDDKIVTRYGVSVLLLEKLVVGLSYGQQDLGLLLGVNVELADLSSLFGG